MQSKKIEFFNEWFKLTVGQDLFDYQKKLLLQKHRLTIVNKSRQIGFSTILAAYGLYHAMRGKNVMVVSPSERQSKHFMEIVFSFWNKMKVKPELSEDTKTSLIFKEGGWIRSFPNSANTVRGYTVNILVLDEFAHFLNQTDRLITEALAPAVTADGEIWYVSTPFGEQNVYYRTWEKATEGKGNFVQIKVNWSECGKDEAILREMTPDPIAFAQEYNNEFIGDVDTWFPWDLIKSCVDTELEYENPVKSHEIYMGIDIGRKVDQTAIVGCTKKEDMFTCMYKMVFKATEFEVQQNFVDTLLNTDQVLKLNIDASGKGEQMAEHFKLLRPSVSNPYTFTAELKDKLVNGLKNLMLRGKIKLPDDPQLLLSIHSIQRMESHTGHLKFDSDRTDLTGHADTAWGLMLAVYDERRPALVFGTIDKMAFKSPDDDEGPKGIPPETPKSLGSVGIPVKPLDTGISFG